MRIQGQNLHLQVPGKTFLVGEYLALAGGPSIVATTFPCFDFSWVVTNARQDRRIQHSFHPKSPAGRLLDSFEPRLPGESNYAITFHDPHFGKGGLGASTAEFIGAWIFEMVHGLADHRELFLNEGGRVELVETLPNHIGEISPRWSSERVGSGRFRDLLDRYSEFVQYGSGADLVSQVTGGIAVWDGVHDQMRRFSWPFTDLSLSLFKTGRKLATHEHLAASVEKQIEEGAPSTRERGLGKSLDPAFESDMREWVKEAIQSLATSDADRFVASVRGTGRLLADSGRLAAHSQAILDELFDVSSVRAAKGCGAMGSDVIMVLHDSTEKTRQYLNEFSNANGLTFAGSESEIFPQGLCVELKG